MLLATDEQNLNQSLNCKYQNIAEKELTWLTVIRWIELSIFRFI